MASSDISSDQFAKLCNRCACLELRNATPDEILPRNPSADEKGGEQEVDLDWNVTDVLKHAFSQSGGECDCCKFLDRVMVWWRFHDGLVQAFETKQVPVSLHYVFGHDGIDQHGLKALRIRMRPDGEEFHIDCPITAATDLDIGTPLKLHPPLSHINEETLSWMNSKLESCVLHDHIKPEKTFIPDRLIDVRENQLSLILTHDLQPRDAEVQRYVALTYCWGPEPHSSKQLKTTSTNVSQHQQQIPEFSLPQVIKDAVAVTRALAIPFLWIDALCILQDDVSDWDKQCPEMERIYGNAYVTVAAASSRNCEEGFIERTDRILLPFRTHSGDSRVFGIYSPVYKADALEDLILSPWLERGWTFQERIASTRILMFSKRNIHFKCKSFSESMGRTANSYNNDLTMLDRATIDSGSTAAIYEAWNDTINQVIPGYHQFTRETDLLPSIAGIAALFSKKLNDEYAAGIWKKNMHQSLCWASMQQVRPSYQDVLKDLETPSPYIAPSWSWASRRDWSGWHLDRFDIADCRPEFDGLEANVTLRGESVFGDVAAATLDIASKVYVGSSRITCYKHIVRDGFVRETTRFDRRYFAEIIPDYSAEDTFEPCETRTPTTPISFLLLGSAIGGCYINEFPFPAGYFDNSETHGSDDGTGSGYESPSSSLMNAQSGSDVETEVISKRAAYGLLIHPTGKPNEYYRVGTFFSSPFFAGGLSFFDDVEVRTVRLV